MRQTASARLAAYFVMSLILILTARAVASPGLEVAVAEGRLTFQGDGIEVSEARPAVELLLGEDRQRLEWTPYKKPAITETEVKTPLGAASQTNLAWEHSKGFQLIWIVTRLQESDAFTLQVEVKNTGAKPIFLRRLSVLQAPEGSVSVSGDVSQWMTSTRYLKYARYYDRLDKLRDRGQLKLDQSDPNNTTREIPYEEDFCLYTKSGNAGLSVSAVTDQAYNWITLGVPENSNALSLEVWSEMTGVLVESGESRRSEQVLFQFAPWRAAGERAVTWMRSVVKPRDTRPVYGWCSWYCAGESVTEEHCFQTADFVQKHQDRYPFETMQVDEGWHIGRHEWYPNAKFASGTKALIDRFQSAGGSAGVWMTPISPNSQRIVDGELFHTGGKGGKGVRSFDPSWYVGYRHGRLGNSLDPSSPGAAEYIVGELSRLKRLGCDYFKTDFSKVAAAESGYHNPKLTSFQAQRLLYSLIRRAIGDESYLLACNGGPARVVAGLADATRIGTDSGTKWAFCQRANEFGKPSNVHGAWFPILQVGCSSAYTGLMACDPDVTRLDNLGYATYDPRFNGRDPSNPDKPMPVKLSLRSVQTFHGLLALYGGTMMVSDLMYETGYQKQNRLRMAEIMHPVIEEQGYNFGGGYDVLCHQFGFEAKRPWGRWISMVTWNPDHRGSKSLAIDKAPTESLGEKFHVWSFWDEQYLGIQDAGFQFDNVRHYHSKLLRLTPVNDKARPTLIGSNLHMAMGASEVKSVSHSSMGLIVDLESTAGAIEGQLVFYSKQPLEVEKATGCNAFVLQSSKDVYTVVVTERERKQPQRITLKESERDPPTLQDVKADTKLAPLWQAGTQTVMQ